LPPLTTLERSQYDLVFHTLAIRNSARFSRPVFGTGGGQRSDAQIFLELAWRMQCGSWFARTTAMLKSKLLQRLGSNWIINKKLKQGPYYRSHGLDLKKLKQNPHGIDLGPLQPCLPGRLFTSDKMINLAPEEFLADLERMKKVIPIANYATGFDLQLIGRRDPRSNNSWLHNSHRMVKGKPRCLALVHPLDAEARRLQDGDLALVSSRVGTIRIPVALSTDMMPGVISIPHGWGHQVDGVELGIARQHAGVNTNILTDDYFLDSVSGNTALNGVRVSLAKAPQ